MLLKIFSLFFVVRQQNLAKKLILRFLPTYGRHADNSYTTRHNSVIHKTLHHKTAFPKRAQIDFEGVYGSKYKNYFFYTQVLKA